MSSGEGAAGAQALGATLGATPHSRNLEGADLRGRDLHAVDLRGADLRGVRTGLLPRWRVVLFFSALTASLALGAFAGVAGRLVQRLLESDDVRQHALAALVLFALLAILVTAAWKGGAAAMRTVVPVTAGSFVLVGALALASGLGPGRGALGAAAFVLLTTALVGLGGLARAVAGVISQGAFVAVAMLGGLLGGWLGGGWFAGLVAVAAVVVGQSALRGRRSYPLLSATVAEIACAHGTRFSGADLRGARFEGTKLVAIDFRGARLEDARFDEAKFHLCLFDAPQHHPPAAQTPNATPHGSVRDAERSAPRR